MQNTKKRKMVTIVGDKHTLSDDSDDSQATKVHAQHYKYYYYNTNLHGDGTHGVLSAAVHVWIKIPEFCSTNILFFVGGHGD